jgi:hypothetical protein
MPSNAPKCPPKCPPPQMAPKCFHSQIADRPTSQCGPHLHTPTLVLLQPLEQRVDVALVLPLEQRAHLGVGGGGAVHGSAQHRVRRTGRARRHRGLLLERGGQRLEAVAQPDVLLADLCTHTRTCVRTRGQGQQLAFPSVSQPAKLVTQHTHATTHEQGHQKIDLVNFCQLLSTFVNVLKVRSRSCH